MQNIHESRQKIKSAFSDGIGEWGLLCVVFLVALASFGLGRLSTLEETRPLVAVIQAPEAQPRPLVAGGFFVASRTGNTYHYPWCAGAAQIAARNQIWFQSEKEAQKAGYAPAKNCKGLQ